MLLQILEGALLRLLQSAVPGIDLSVATAVADKLILLATNPEEFWMAYNVAVAEAVDGQVPSILDEGFKFVTGETLTEVLK